MSPRDEVEEAYVKEVVAAAPPFTAKQIEVLRRIWVPHVLRGLEEARAAEVGEVDPS